MKISSNKMPFLDKLDYYLRRRANQADVIALLETLMQTPKTYS